MPFSSFPYENQKGEAGGELQFMAERGENTGTSSANTQHFWKQWKQLRARCWFSAIMRALQEWEGKKIKFVSTVKVIWAGVSGSAEPQEHSGLHPKGEKIMNRYFWVLLSCRSEFCSDTRKQVHHGDELTQNWNSFFHVFSQPRSNKTLTLLALMFLRARGD